MEQGNEQATKYTIRKHPDGPVMVEDSAGEPYLSQVFWIIPLPGINLAVLRLIDNLNGTNTTPISEGEHEAVFEIDSPGQTLASMERIAEAIRDIRRVLNSPHSTDYVNVLYPTFSKHNV